jgi:hypothetical protein
MAKVKVKMKVAMTSATGDIRRRGDVVEVEAEKAERYVDANVAEYVGAKPATPSKSKSSGARQTATKGSTRRKAVSKADKVKTADKS